MHAKLRHRMRKVKRRLQEHCAKHMPHYGTPIPTRAEEFEQARFILTDPVVSRLLRHLPRIRGRIMGEAYRVYVDRLYPG